ncbi:hypothetical protein GW17_00046192 [Ensete ventricosum]|nr:hypothetical protein GW17_00046192 [Ensete ventricosum]RZS27664.1 hypothetical protein BHM03_00061183 [Ensete ventricosum]
MIAFKVKASPIRSFIFLHALIDLVMMIDVSRGNNMGEALDAEACNTIYGFLFKPRGLVLHLWHY